MNTKQAKQGTEKVSESRNARLRVSLSGDVTVIWQYFIPRALFHGVFFSEHLPSLPSSLFSHLLKVFYLNGTLSLQKKKTHNIR